MLKTFLPSTGSLLGLLLFFACRNDRGTMATLHTDMGDIRVKLFDKTPRHRDNFLQWPRDTLPIYHVERDQAVRFGTKNSPAKTAERSIAPEIGALPIGGALAAVADESGRSDGVNFFIILDRPQTEASLDALEKKLRLKFSDAERKAYCKKGGLPALQNGVTVFGEVTEGLEVAQRIAALPRDSTGRPLRPVRVWLERN